LSFFLFERLLVPLGVAPQLERVVDELAAVVGVEDADGNGQRGEGAVQGLVNPPERLVS